MESSSVIHLRPKWDTWHCSGGVDTADVKTPLMSWRSPPTNRWLMAGFLSGITLPGNPDSQHFGHQNTPTNWCRDHRLSHGRDDLQLMHPQHGQDFRPTRSWLTSPNLIVNVPLQNFDAFISRKTQKKMSLHFLLVCNSVCALSCLCVKQIVLT